MADIDLATHFLADARRLARQYRGLAERALAQVDEEGFFAELDDDANSLAVLVKHLGGNLRSRWRDFLTTDGEKPDRNRDGEFVLGAEDSRERLMDLWAEGWGHLLGTLDVLAPADVERTVTIRGEPHTVVEAVGRALAHVAYHVGQIVQLSRHHRKGSWQSLSIPRGASEAFTRKMRGR
jgi:hypothetical protein